MADDQETSNDAGEEGYVADYDTIDAIDTTDIPTTPPAPIIDNAVNPSGEEYDDDEVLPDVTVKLYINDDPNGPAIPTDLVNAGLTDIYGNVITTKSPWSDSVDGYTTAISQEIYDGITGNGTDIGGKRWWGTWTWNKALLVAFIGLCIIGIILALLFIIIGKKFKKNKRSSPVGITTTTKSVVTQGISPKQEYSKVPSSV